MRKNDENWMTNYEVLKAYIAEHGHLPDKHKIESCALLSWAKYQRRKIKEGTLDADKKLLIKSLLASRSTEYAGGRYMKIRQCIIHVNNRHTK